jgi:hypothetical protein
VPVPVPVREIGAGLFHPDRDLLPGAAGCSTSTRRWCSVASIAGPRRAGGPGCSKLCGRIQDHARRSAAYPRPLRTSRTGTCTCTCTGRNSRTRLSLERRRAPSPADRSPCRRASTAAQSRAHQGLGPQMRAGSAVHRARSDGCGESHPMNTFAFGSSSAFEETWRGLYDGTARTMSRQTIARERHHGSDEVAANR